MKLELTLDTLPALDLIRLLDNERGYDGLKDFEIVEAQLEDGKYKLSIEGSLDAGKDYSEKPGEFLNVLYSVVNDRWSQRENPFRFVNGLWTSNLVKKLDEQFTDQSFDSEYQIKQFEDGESELEVYIQNPNFPGIRISRFYDLDMVAKVLSEVKGDRVFAHARPSELVRIDGETDAGAYLVEFRPQRHRSKIEVTKAEGSIDESKHFPKGLQEGQAYSRSDVDRSIIGLSQELYSKKK